MAAAVFIPPSPHDPFSKMSNASRRVPLASISNATNSPHRPLQNSGSKRPRSLANVSQQENEHPQKRLAVEKNARDSHAPATPHRQTQPTMAEGRVFERGTGDSGSTAFQRRLVAAREKTAGLRVTKHVDDPGKEETIRTWQRHYRKLFPSYRFYFDAVTEETRARFLRQITALGAVCSLLTFCGHDTNYFVRKKKSSFPKPSRTSLQLAIYRQNHQGTTTLPSTRWWKNNPRPSTLHFLRRTHVRT